MGKKYTDEEIVNALQRNQELSIGEWEEKGIKPSTGTIKYRFGSWNEGREKAGLEKRPNSLSIEHPKHKEKYKERMKLYKNGLNDREIAEREGVTTEAICAWRNRRDLEPNAPFGGQPIEIDLTPRRELGYFCGLCLGDAHIHYREETCNYSFTMKSTKTDIIEVFSKFAEKLGMNINKMERIETRSFPNGETRTDKMYSAFCNSKLLYEAIEPFIKDDFRWKIPDFISNEKCINGFLSGYSDAEGSVIYHNARGIGPEPKISIYSKHKETLENIRSLFDKVGITPSPNITYAGNSCSCLNIFKKNSLMKFSKNIGFELERKRNKLNEGIKTTWGLDFENNGK